MVDPAVPVLFLALLWQSAAPADLEGSWEGSARVAGQVRRIGFDFPAGGASGRLGLPELGVLDRPVTLERDASGGWLLELEDERLGHAVFSGSVAGRFFTGRMLLDTQSGTERGLFACTRIARVRAEQLSGLTGEFAIEGLGRATVTLAPDPRTSFLEISAASRGTTRLVPWSATEFVAGLDPDAPEPLRARIEFTRDAQGNVGLVLHEGGADRCGQRLPEAFACDAARIAAQVAQMQADRNVPGYSLGIVHEDQLVYAAGFGLADLEQATPASPATLYQIGSVTKTFAAALALKLRDRGLLDLDAPLLHYLPGSARWSQTAAWCPASRIWPAGSPCTSGPGPRRRCWVPQPSASSPLLRSCAAACSTSWGSAGGSTSPPGTASR